MPVIRPRKSFGPAALSLALCLALTGCWDDFIVTNPNRPLAPVVVSDWLGEYDGTATARVFATGSVYSDVPSHLTIERVSEENVDIRLSVGVFPRPADLEDIGDFTGGPFDSAGVGWRLVVPGEEIVLKSSASVTYQYANRRNRLSMARITERLTGFLYVDVQKADGSYEVVGEIEVNVVERP